MAGVCHALPTWQTPTLDIFEVVLSVWGRRARRGWGTAALASCRAGVDLQIQPQALHGLADLVFEALRLFGTDDG